MGYQRTNFGEPLKLRLQLFDGEPGVFPVAHVYDEDQNEVAGSPFALTHAANGMYTNDAFTPSTEGKYDAVFIVYDDVGHTTESALFGRAQDNFDVSIQGAGVGGGSSDAPIGIVESDPVVGVIEEC